MWEIIGAIHKALKIESTWGFVAVIALIGALLGGAAAWIIDVGYKNSAEYKAEHPPKQQAAAETKAEQPTTAQPNNRTPQTMPNGMSVEFHMPPSGWMTAWGSKPPDVAYAVAEATQFVPYKDQLRLLLVCRVVDDLIDELQDENIQKSPAFTPTQSAMSMEMHMSRALMGKAATYPPPQMIHVALVLIKSDVDLGKIKKLADVQPLGGTILVVNGFGMNVKTHRTWVPGKSSDVSTQPDNSVHIDRGSKIEQQSSGDCSPNIIGGNSRVTCAPQPRIPNSAVERLSAQLALCPSGSTTAIPGVVNPTGFTEQDAQNLAAAFAKTRSWNYSGVGHTTKGQDIGPDGPIPDPVGIHISADATHQPLATCVKAALKSVGVESVVEPKQDQGNSLGIVVGNAPN
jgi:hypothetical protein